MKLVLCAVLVTYVAAIQAQEVAGAFQDYWEQDDYDTFYGFPDDSQNIEAKQEDTEKHIEVEKQDSSALNDGFFDPLADYQFEDNRSDNDDKEASKENVDDVPAVEPVPDDAPQMYSADLQPPEPNSDKAPEENHQDEEKAQDNDAWDEVNKPLPVVEKEMQPEEEQLAQQLAENPASEEKPAVHNVEQSDLDQIIEDTNRLLKENDDVFQADDYDVNSDEDEKSFGDLFSDINDNETPEKVLGDLNSDLDKLFETLEKLSDNDSNIEEKAKDADNANGVDVIKDYEEKFNRPYGEGYILSLRDDYNNYDDGNAPDADADNASSASKEDNVNEDAGIPEEIAANSNQDSIEKPDEEKTIDELVDRILAEDNNENADVVDKNNNQPSTEKLAVKENLDENEYSSEEFDKLLGDDSDENNDEELDDLIDELLRRSYGNDGLVDDQQLDTKNAEILSTSQAPQTTQQTDAAQTEVPQTSEVKQTTQEDITTAPIEGNSSPKMADGLSSSEYDQLMDQFAIGERIQEPSADFAKPVNPIYISLSVEEPTVITSPNYPGMYPVNTTVDWIVDGAGNGIELNVTHMQLNGGLGDFVLVKPGGVDASGTDGILFSGRLRAERRYRFTNVNRMFIRFQSKPGMQFLNGFSLSARMIWPLPTFEDEEVPVPEPVLRPPTDTLALSLAGLALPQFHDIKPAFRELIADMAQEYIIDNEIDEGLNTTLEVTQITRTAVCNIRWPNYETCVEVTFGVPLHYEESTETRLNADDLDAMWRTYIVKEEFAARLREMGITEYAIPNDRTVLMVWLVIAAGVVISMAMLGFALWRFSCFEDYTRMRTFNDADSIQNEKKNLDLYPTPHQTLPPLYSESDYKWADDKYDDSTRVDMGGFANKSYIRDDLFEFDSDEEVITPHDRNGAIKPRDVYEV